MTLGKHSLEDSDATFVVDAHGRIEDVDDSACVLLGYSRDQLRGLHGSHLVPPAARPATAASLDRMRRGEIDFRQGTLRRRNGAVLRVEVRARALKEGRLTLCVRRTSG
jgi:PAS domain S-box-containing protein